MSITRYKGWVIEHSCPNFDDAIKEIEKARGINSDLRDALEDAIEEIDKINDELTVAQDTIRDLEEKCEEYKKDLATTELERSER